MELIPVTDPADPRLRDYTDLTDVQLRRVREPAEGLFLAEGEKVIHRALAAGHPVRSVLTEEKWLPGLTAVLPAGTPVYLAAPELLERVTGYAVHRGALASMARLPLPSLTELLARVVAPTGQAGGGGGPTPGRAPRRRVAVLEDIVDHTNVGAAFRSAAALGVDAVLVTPRCADPLYRRSVKVSMGTVLQVPWTRVPSWPEGIAELRAAGFTTAALALDERAITLDELAARDDPRLALVLGTEGDGLRRSTVAEADVVVRIPMAAGVDSLNVAAAAAVAFYAVTRG